MILWVAAATGCASLPPSGPERGLYTDLEKIVELRERSGWEVDRLELEAGLGNALSTACRVPPDARLRLDRWLTQRIEAEGGPAEARFREGAPLCAVESAMTLERQRALLRHAEAHVAQDCPFWVEPDPEFAGIQGDAGRVVLLAESMGGGGVFIEDGEVAFGGGGAARLLVGYGVGPRTTLALGAEFGGMGSFVRQDSGLRSLEGVVTAGVPVLMRNQRGARVIDLELAPVAQIQSGGALRYGGRGAVGIGLSALRAGPWMPYAVFWVGYEMFPAQGDQLTSHAIRVGTRIGVDFDFGG